MSTASLWTTLRMKWQGEKSDMERNSSLTDCGWNVLLFQILQKPIPVQIRVPWKFSFFNFTENPFCKEALTQHRILRMKERSSPFTLMERALLCLVTYTYTDVIKIIPVLLLKSTVPKHEAISEAEITIFHCLRYGEGIWVGFLSNHEEPLFLPSAPSAETTWRSNLNC